MIEIKNLVPKFEKKLYRHPAVLILTLGFIFVLSASLYNNYFHKHSEPVSRLLFSYNGKLYNTQTTQRDLVSAVQESGINPYKQDEFSIPRDTKLIGQSLEFSIKISWPVVIYDDNRRIEGRTTKTDAAEILAQNEITTWPEDIINTELIMNPVGEKTAGQTVNIKRAPRFTVQVDGKTKEVRSWDTNVKAIIDKSETKLNPNDIVMPSVENTVASGTSIVIFRVEYVFVTKNEPIPFNTVYQGSTALALGQSQTLVAGVAGSKTVNYKITYKDGEEVSRVAISTNVTAKKQDAKVLRGAVTGKCKWGPFYESNFGPYTTAFHFARDEHNPAFKGRYILVTNLDNGKSVKVKVVDAGPIYDGILDLSTTAMREIGGPLVTFYGNIPNIMVQMID